MVAFKFVVDRFHISSHFDPVIMPNLLAWHELKRLIWFLEPGTTDLPISYPSALCTCVRHVDAIIGVSHNLYGHSTTFNLTINRGLFNLWKTQRIVKPQKIHFHYQNIKV